MKAEVGIPPDSLPGPSVAIPRGEDCAQSTSSVKKGYSRRQGPDEKSQTEEPNEPAMNSLTSFLALTAAIFGGITALLALLSRLEPTWRAKKASVAPEQEEGLSLDPWIGSRCWVGRGRGCAF